MIETGTRQGGSALYFADLLELSGAHGRVLTIDNDHRDLQVREHPRIDFILGDSAKPGLTQQLARSLPRARGPLFMILDSDHRAAHVARELELLTPLLRASDYLVVEDTCVNGHPVRPSFGPGPMEALLESLGRHPGEYTRDLAREEKFGFTCAPLGYLIRNS